VLADDNHRLNRLQRFVALTAINGTS